MDNKYVFNCCEKKVVEFGDLEIGAYFIFHGNYTKDVRLKIGEHKYLNTNSGVIYCTRESDDYGSNNYDADSCADSSTEVYPLRADIRLDYIYEGKE